MKMTGTIVYVAKFSSLGTKTYSYRVPCRKTAKRIALFCKERSGILLFDNVTGKLISRGPKTIMVYIQSYIKRSTPLEN